MPKRLIYAGSNNGDFVHLVWTTTDEDFNYVVLKGLGDRQTIYLLLALNVKSESIVCRTRGLDVFTPLGILGRRAITNPLVRWRHLRLFSDYSISSGQPTNRICHA